MIEKLGDGEILLSLRGMFTVLTINGKYYGKKAYADDFIELSQG